MCAVEEITSCQLSFIPIQSENYLADIDMVLRRITASGLEYSIGEMSTIIKGGKANILKLISDLYDLMTPKCSFVIDIRISNTCACISNIVGQTII
ncbi:MAG: hypothetical protein A2Y23_10000 [Clostridiales bacterium GWB2_37_7]|nr:MAG: hypothetical protein A2Y23_10000 [Clostridiales bacterium GWB2_37_7]